MKQIGELNGQTLRVEGLGSPFRQAGIHTQDCRLGQPPLQQ